jgi:hypothetical protein
MGTQIPAAAESHEIVIQGLTEAGDTFRPSDWAERLCGMMSVFGEDRLLSYSPFLKPIMASGVRCVVVDRQLESIDQAAFAFLMAFANDNELRLRPGRKSTPEPDLPPVVERRSPDPLDPAEAIRPLP